MANRKLQAEIERTLKKVSEGLEIFHETLEKLDAATSASHKEKIEVELKKEIKKLQRLRDLIKGWQAMSELKDKQAINEARRNIELEMERFKVLEKEMKIKAYSKEGLSQAAKLDPKEYEKLKVGQWINQAVDKLSTQTDALEAELEGLQIQAKKSKQRLDGEKQSRLDDLPDVIERHKMHMRKLDQLLRLVGNERFTPEEVNAIKDDVEYYVEANQDPDFIADETLYDHFDLGDESDEDDSGSDDDSDGDSMAGDSDDDRHNHLVQRGGKKTTSASASAPAPTVQTKKPIPTSNSAASTPTTPVSVSVTSAKKISSPPASTLPLPMPMSSVVAAATLTSATAAATPTTIPGAPSSATASPVPLSLSLPSLSSVPPPPLQSMMGGKGPSFASAIAAGSTAATPTTLAGRSVTMNAPPSASTQATTAGAIGASSKASQTRAIALPGPYADLQAILQRRKAGDGKTGEKKSTLLSLTELLPLVESSYANCPDAFELERSKTYTPKQPFSVPSYYPSQFPPILSDPSIFERFELDTLFFIFYYQQRTYGQYLAARELKRQSWRFHKKYLTWFQRHEEPKIITDEFEQGTYIYFDYEGNWCQRKKSEFTFEYRYLEDEETV